MKYSLNYPNNLKNWLIGFSISLFQYTAAILTEGVTMLLICGQDNPLDCVLNFLALSVIAQIDDMYAASLKLNPLI